MEESLGKYLEQYSLNISKKLGNEFTFDSFADAIKKDSGLQASGLSQNFINDNIDFPWLPELEIVTEKIMAIASKPRSHIKFEKEVKKSEQAVKIDNFDIIETLKVPKFWRQKDERFLPEYIYTDNYETELAIYENRFIINLVDKMMLFLSQVVAMLYEKVKKVNHNFIDYHVSISDVEILQDIAGFDTFKYVPKSSKREKRKKDEDSTLLTTKDSPYVDALRRILVTRANVTHVLSTPFYKAVKKAKPLSDSDIHITNMLAGDKTYAPCYNFYRKLLTLLSNNREMEEAVNPKDYHNFVISNLIDALKDHGFAGVNGKSKISFKGELLHMSNFTLVKDDVECFITTHDEDHIDMTFKVAERHFKKDDNIAGKLTSKVSIDLVPTTTVEYPNDEELAPYFRKKITTRLKSGYTNAFVITTVDNTQKDDVIICSPYVYKIDANVKSMVESCLIFSEGDAYIYSHLCPVCGFYVDGELEDGNCYCANCESVYSLMSSGSKDQVKESVWIKRLKNPEKI